MNLGGEWRSDPAWTNWFLSAATRSVRRVCDFSHCDGRWVVCLLCGRIPIQQSRGGNIEPLRYHVFICEQKKPEGIPCCASRGSAATIDALRKEVAARGLMDEIQITLCGSLGLCERGPNDFRSSPGSAGVAVEV
jgi:hypothetical protein